MLSAVKSSHADWRVDSDLWHGRVREVTAMAIEEGDAAVALILNGVTLSRDRETLIELVFANLAWRSPCQKRFCEGGTTRPAIPKRSIWKEMKVML